MCFRCDIADAACPCGARRLNKKPKRLDWEILPGRRKMAVADTYHPRGGRSMVAAKYRPPTDLGRRNKPLTRWLGTLGMAVFGMAGRRPDGQRFPPPRLVRHLPIKGQTPLDKRTKREYLLSQQARCTVGVAAVGTSLPRQPNPATGLLLGWLRPPDDRIMYAMSRRPQHLVIFGGNDSL